MLHARPHRPVPTESHGRALRRCAESCIVMADEIILYRTEDGKNQVNLMWRDGMVWLNQSQMAELFATSKQNIAYHISNILEDNELSYEAVVKEYLTTALDGKNYKKGRRRSEQAEHLAYAEYDKFKEWRKSIARLKADREDAEELKRIDEDIKRQSR